MLRTIKLLFILIVASQIVGCNNDQKKENKTQKIVAKKLAPKMDFKGKNLVDLGTITEGEKITHTFEFENTGNAPLQISYANASCGCTVPTWPKEAIAPGGKSAITVEFNSKNKEGKLLKNVSIYSNTIPEFNTVAFNIEVVKRK
jgi:Protein of unknown function (DUF1573)